MLFLIMPLTAGFIVAVIAVIGVQSTHETQGRCKFASESVTDAGIRQTLEYHPASEGMGTCLLDEISLAISTL